MNSLEAIRAAQKIFNQSKNKLSAFEAIDQTCGDYADKVKWLFTSMVGDMPSFAARYGRKNVAAIFDDAISAIRMCQFFVKSGEPLDGIELNVIELAKSANQPRG